MQASRTCGLLALALAVLAAGCVAPAPADAQDADVPDPARAAAPPEPRRTLLEYENDLPAVEADALCTFGGGVRMERTEPARITEGTDHVEVAITTDPGRWNTQIGYAIDGDRADSAQEETAEIHWLPPAKEGEVVHRVPVSADAVEAEDGPLRWAFYRQVNPGDASLCYTGVGAGAITITITAVAADA